MEFASTKIAKYAQFAGKTLPVPPATEFVDAEDKTFHGSVWRHVDSYLTDGTIYVDKVTIPNLPEGKYILQWRWDTMNTAQVWTSCANIELSDSPVPPSPSPGPSPTPGCHAISPVVTDDWCVENCALGNCPATLCSCGGSIVV